MHSNTGEKVSTYEMPYELNYKNEQCEDESPVTPQPNMNSAMKPPTAKVSQRDAKESICVDFSSQNSTKPNYIKVKKKVKKPPLMKQRSMGPSERASFGPQNSSQVQHEGLNSTRSMRLVKKSTISDNGQPIPHVIKKITVRSRGLESER